MRKFLTQFFIFSILCSQAQSLTSPESVEYDPLYDRYLISNSSDGNIVARDQMGAITAFVSGIPSGPYGLEILDSVVYACAGNSVRGYALTTGVQVFSLNVGAQFLNGITTDGTFIYVTDFNGDKIIKVDVQASTFSVLVANTNGTPNGIVYDPDFGTGILWTAFWNANAPVKGYLLDGSAGPVIATTLSSIDGITLDCFGNLYLASWSPDRITRVEVGTGVQTNMGWTVSNPADIDFDAVHGLICIPNTSDDTVTLEEVTACITAVHEVSKEAPMVLYPNPTNTIIQIRGTRSNTSYRILDSAMRTVQSGSLRGNGSINVGGLLSGLYFFEVQGEAGLMRFVVED